MPAKQAASRRATRRRSNRGCYARFPPPNILTNPILQPALAMPAKQLRDFAPDRSCVQEHVLPLRPGAGLECVSQRRPAAYTRSLSGIRNHNLDLIVRAALSSAKSEAGTPALPHLFASERPQGPFSQPRHGFSLLIA